MQDRHRKVAVTAACAGSAVAAALIGYTAFDATIVTIRELISGYRATIERAEVENVEGIERGISELSGAIAEERRRFYSPGESSDARFSAEIEQDLKRASLSVRSCRPSTATAGGKAVHSVEFEVSGRGESILSFLALCRDSGKSRIVSSLTVRFSADTGLIESRIRIGYEQNETPAAR